MKAMKGYNSSIESTREHEFPGLSGMTYLDHAGATIYARSQLELVHQDLMTNIYGNPHSPCNSSRLSTDTIDQVRYRILKHFNTSPEFHSVIFTAGCTAALKLLANNFDWASVNPRQQDETREVPEDYPNIQEGAGLFCYLMDNHTSVVGMREIAKAKGANSLCISYEDIRNNSSQCKSLLVNGRRRNCLFAYPAQSNFSGAKYPLNLVSSVKSHSLSLSQPDHWAVVLDAASLVSTSPLDLSECTTDFVAVSFYKIFGFPTGLGALIVRNDAAQFLQKTYFGGGTVQAYLARQQFNIPKSSLSDQFEDGTLPFLDIITLRHGFDAIEKLAGNMRTISDHTFGLAKYVHHKLALYRHANGQPIANLYCDNDFESKDLQGPIVNFLLLRSTGEFVGYTQIERLASLHGIHLRTGCFCNTGACQRHLGLQDEQILHNFQAGHVCGDEMDLINGQPTGSVRISFGYMSTLADADSFLSFVQECFIEKATMSPSAPESLPSPGSKVLTNIFVYPVKSCSAFEVTEWETGPMGLLYDRYWMIVNDSGVCLSQKREERLCHIKPIVDLQSRCLLLKCQGQSTVSIPLDVGSKNYVQSKVCLDRVETLDCGDEVAKWLSAALGRPCRLLRQNPEFERNCRLKDPVDDNKSSSHQSLSLVNESPFTLLCRPSARSLLNAIRERYDSDPSQPFPAPLLGEESGVHIKELIGRFRGNFVIDGWKAFDEDDWKKIQIGHHVFKVAGVCIRCQMVCVDQNAAKRSKEPLLTLSKYRGKKVPFGIHLLRDAASSEVATLRVGDNVSILQCQ